MGRPTGSKNRIRLATPSVPVPHVVAQSEAAEFTPEMFDAIQQPSQPPFPSFWGRGALLNVRNTGSDYCVTLYPEEYDPRSPERALRFTNPAEAQNFVSRWYMRESHDPRAR